MGAETKSDVSSCKRWTKIIIVETIWNPTVRIDKPAIVSLFLQYETSFLNAKASNKIWKAENTLGQSDDISLKIPDTMNVIRRMYISVSTRSPLTSSISFSWNPMSVNPRRLLSIFTKSLNFPIPNGRYRIVNSCSEFSISLSSSSRKLSSRILILVVLLGDFWLTRNIKHSLVCDLIFVQW